MGKIKEIKVVIDTNVVISALLFSGTPTRLVELWKKRNIRPFISKEIIDELLRVLAYPKFHLSQKEINYLVYQEIIPYFETVDAVSGETIIHQDPTDDKFIFCALAADAKNIISGDKHLISLKSYGDIDILTPLQFLNSFSTY